MTASQDRHGEAFEQLFGEDGNKTGALMDRRQPVRFKTIRLSVFYLTGSIFLICLIYFVFTRLSAPLSAVIDRQDITTSPVQTVQFDAVFEISGQLESKRNFQVTADIAGKVSSVRVTNGEQVVAREILAVLENSETPLQLGRSKAAAAKASSALQDLRVKIEQSRFDHERSVLRLQDEVATLEQRLEGRQVLAQEGFVPQSDVQTVAMNLERKRKFLDLELSAFEALDNLYAIQLNSAEIVLQSAREERDLSARALSALTVRAPASGQISGFDLSPGQRLSAGEAIAQIRDPKTPIIRAYVDEYYLSSLQTGQAAEILLAGDLYEAHLFRIETDIVQGQFPAEWRFYEPLGTMSAGLELGQSVRVRHHIGDSQKKLAIETGDYLNTRSGQYVYVVQDNVARRQMVRLGRRNDQYIEVLGGLEAGETIVTSTYEPFLDIEEIKVR